MIKHLKIKYKILADRIIDLHVLKKGASDRVYQLDVIYRDLSGNKNNTIIESEYRIRDLLSESFLFSSAFTIKKENKNYILYGKGWGHGVGMCQIGALGMSLLKKQSLQILHHYFPGAEVKKIYHS